MLKEHEVGEDDEKHALQEVQKLTDKHGKLRVRADTFGYLQRSFPGVYSEVDRLEAREVGRFADVQEHRGVGIGATATVIVWWTIRRRCCSRLCSTCWLNIRGKGCSVNNCLLSSAGYRYTTIWA